MRLNHIGIATDNVSMTTSLLEFYGYMAGPIMYDENQNVNVRFLFSEDAPTIELLFPAGGVKQVILRSTI